MYWLVFIIVCEIYVVDSYLYSGTHPYVIYRGEKVDEMHRIHKRLYEEYISQFKGFLNFNNIKLKQWIDWEFWREYRFGFPDNSIGSIFPVVSVSAHACPKDWTDDFFDKIFVQCFFNYFTRECGNVDITDVDIPVGTKDPLSMINDKVKACVYSVFRDWFIEYTFFFDPEDRDKDAERMAGYVSPEGQDGINKVFNQCKKDFITSCSSSTHRFCQPYRFCGLHYFVQMYANSLSFRINRMIVTPMQTTTYMMGLFINFYCQQKWVRGHDPLCPNPCHPTRNPCMSVENSYLGRCIILNNGVHESDFECSCNDGYLWEPISKQCVGHNKCSENDAEGYPCDRKGTARCIYAPGLVGQAAHACICKVTHMGHTCKHLRDPCVQRADVTQPAGFFACRTNLGGECVPRIGTDYYECKCPAGWDHLNKAEFPNCYMKKVGCASLLCHNNGHCVSSRDEKAVMCVCQGGWSGKHCDQQNVHEWMPWEAWTACTSLCGEGWRSRRRLCRSGNNKDCSGQWRQLHQCDRKCDRVEEIYMPLLKILLILQVLIFFGGFLTSLVAQTLRFRFPVLWDLAKRIKDKREEQKKTQ